MKKIGIKNKNGFTLIEALLASVVLATGLFVVGLAIYTEFTFIYQNREKAIATLSAQEYIERLRGMSFDQVASVGSSWAMNASNKPPAFAYLQNPLGTVTVSDSYGSDIKKISVTVSWSSLAGRTLEIKLATLMSRNGINKQ